MKTKTIASAFAIAAALLGGPSASANDELTRSTSALRQPSTVDRMAHSLPLSQEFRRSKPHSYRQLIRGAGISEEEAASFNLNEIARQFLGRGKSGGD